MDSDLLHYTYTYNYMERCSSIVTATTKQISVLWEVHTTNNAVWYNTAYNTHRVHMWVVLDAAYTLCMSVTHIGWGIAYHNNTMELKPPPRAHLSYRVYPSRDNTNSKNEEPYMYISTIRDRYIPTCTRHIVIPVRFKNYYRLCNCFVFCRNINPFRKGVSGNNTYVCLPHVHAVIV